MDSIKWGIIGCGNVTEVKSGPAFNLVNNSELVAVMRRDGAKAADYAARHAVPKWYNDAEELMNDTNINAVYIATPPGSHLDLAVRALKKGLHVYVEKPITLNTAEAVEMMNAANDLNGKLCVAHYRRGLPVFNFVKQLLAEKKIGDVRLIDLKMWKAPLPADVEDISANWRLDPANSGGGYFHDLAPHQLDLIVWYFGLPLQITGIAANQMKISKADDMVCGSILFKDDIVFNGSWNWALAESSATDECTIAGSKGSISFPVFGSTVTLKNEEVTQQFDFTNPKHIQQPMIDAVVKYFRGEGESLCTMQEACAVMEIMDVFTGKKV